MFHKKFAAVLAFLVSPTVYADSVLCMRNENQLSFAQHVELRNYSEGVTLLNWNTHKLADAGFIRDLTLLSQSVDIVTLQEAMHSDEYQQQMVNALNFNFSFHKSFCNKKNEATGVLNAARFQLLQNQTLVSPDTEPILKTPKVSGYSYMEINGVGPVHIINTHALNFNLGSKFKRHVNSVANFISTLQGPVIWIGDFNTWNRDRMQHLVSLAQRLQLAHINLNSDRRTLKLDHVFVRGLKIESAELLNEYNTSDHKPIRIVFKKM